MGHIDHGKSTLLDYIRKTNIVDKEAGGITQHISAYEVVHADPKGVQKRITFLDTPGHEAFSAMRNRGGAVADIAILVVSAEDSVKPQTLEAFATIKKSNIPFVVAINKIDKPGANVEKTKMDLAEKEIYLENYGGTVPFALISAKTGEGIDHLLELLLLVAELLELRGDAGKDAEGVIIEAHRDTKRGISASLVIKDGTLSKGMYVVAGTAMASTRIFEDFAGKVVDSAVFSSPIRLTGFDALPEVGSIFASFENKKDAEAYVEKNKQATISTAKKEEGRHHGDTGVIIPIIVKADVYGSLEAVEKEIEKLTTETVGFKIIGDGVGAIGEGDVRLASSDKTSIILGFNVKIDTQARELNEMMHVEIQTFDIIYKLTEWLAEEVEKRRPRTKTEESTGKLKVQKTFSRTKERQVVGGKVLEGRVVLNGIVKILRRDFEIGRGKIINIEQGKVKAKEVTEGIECGLLLESKIDIAPGDMLESFNIIEK